MNHNLELKLQAWLDGELSEPEARRIGEEIAGDTAATRLTAELQSIKTALVGNETALAVPETREFYWSKIERQIQRETRSLRPVQAPRASWLRWLSPLAGFAALACMLLLAVKPPTLPAFDEISSTGEGMEAVTFHDQSAGMTVVWLADTEQAQPTETIETPAVKTPDTGDTEVEME
jgi:ferric-dicitrate binding protein FerR (iron transport regulator)